MRKFLAILIAFLLPFSIPFAQASAQSNQDNYQWRVLHNGACLYKEASIAEGANVIAHLEQSAEITLLNTELYKVEHYSFYFVEANGIQGYILANDIYYSRRDYVYDIVYKTVITKELFGKAAIYRYPDEQSEIVGEFYKDGSKVGVVKSADEYGKFEKIVYQEGYAYMQRDNLTSGLSKGQGISIIIAGIVVVIVALATFLLIKARKSLQNTTNNS